MTSPDKRLIGPGEHAELHARWVADTPDLAAQRTERERAEFASAHPQIVLSPMTGRDRDVLGAAGAWLALGIVVLLMLALAIRNIWMVIVG